jgi:hypothetical protein
LAARTHSFEFHKRPQLFISAHDETLSIVAMCVNNPNCSPDGIDRGDATQLQPDALSLSAMISQYFILLRAWHFSRRTA